MKIFLEEAERESNRAMKRHERDSKRDLWTHTDNIPGIDLKACSSRVSSSGRKKKSG